jgi:hypothetical protein
VTLKLTAPTAPSDATFQRVLASLPAGNHWVRGNVIPYNANTESVVLQLTATPGVLAEIYVNEKLVLRTDVGGPSTLIDIQVSPGENTVLVKQGNDSYQTLLVAANYAVYLRAFADETYGFVERRVEEFEQHFASYFSTLLTEHQMTFAGVLPSSFAYRTLLAKLASRALVNESPNTRGVLDLVTATTLSTPVVQDQIATSDPTVYAKYTDAQDFGGYTFHVWMANACAASWHGYVRLLDTFYDPDHLAPVSTSDAKVVVRHEGDEIASFFDTEAASCSELEDPCETDSYIWARITSYLPIYVCPWSKPFDTSVTLPLGRSRFDEGTELDSGGSFDSSDETAPPDGWMGLIFTSRFDSGECLDTSVGGLSSIGSMPVCCSPPTAAVLVESVDTFVISAPSYISGSMRVIPG